MDAVPHDLLKVVDWKRHINEELVKEVFPETVKGKYLVTCRDYEGKDEFRTLEQIITGHHSTGAFWERLWAFSDRLSTVAGRFRLEYDYWHSGQASPFFVRVYGDIKEWDSEEREKLGRCIVDVLVQYCDRREEHVDAFREINELLREFPADSRFPFTSLKTHHWLTTAIYKNRDFWLKVKEKKEFKNIFIVRISVPEPEFHKLKELRSFRELCSRTLQIVEKRLSSWLPLQIGDDLYTVCLERDDVDKIRQILEGTGFGFDVDVFEWTIERERKATKPDGSEETIYIVKKSELTLESVGVHEEFEYVPEKLAEYTGILDGDFDYVAWVCIKPKGDMKQVAKEFLEWGEKTLEQGYGTKRIPLKEPVREPAEFLSPELALSLAEGYNEFLKDCATAINKEEPDASTIVRSFNEALFVCGLDEPSDAFRIYTALADKKAKLHMPAVLNVAMAKPKHPFWRILEIFKSADADCLIFVVGDKMVRLTDEDVSLLREVIPKLKYVTRSQFSEIVADSRRVGVEELKFRIEGKAADGKIPWDASKNLCQVIEQLSKRYKGEELKGVIYRGLKMLEPFTRRDRR